MADPAAVLVFSADSPPLSVIAAAKLAAVAVTVDPSAAPASSPLLRLPDGTELRGTNTLLQYFGRVAALPYFYGRETLESKQIDQWLDYAPIFSSGAGFELACTHVDNYLTLRTFLVGYSFTVADLSVWAGLAGVGQRWESLRKSSKYPNLVRWFNAIATEFGDALNEVMRTYVGKRGLGKPLAKCAEQVSAQTSKAANGEVIPKEKTSDYAVDLPGAEVGKVCLRFAPEPSGYLHIGHTKAALLNQYFAQRYQGRLIIRFDDTNPSKEKGEFVENLLKDIDTLGIKYDAITHTSDYFAELMDMCENLIKQGKAYVDDTPRNIMQEERMDGIESKCRNNTVEENLRLWSEMINGSERGMQCCVRGKLDMQDPNKTLRDPVYYRCNPEPHHRIGSKYNVYPTYDFACPYVDSKEGITHALRASEYHDRNAQYQRILDDMGMRQVQLYEFSRLNLVYTLLSKRKLLWFVENEKVEGWNDPRFPTVQGIVRRGLKVEALIEFILQQGASKNLNLMEWDKLWTINRRIIDPVCPRFTAIPEKRRVAMILTDGPDKPFIRILPKHKKYELAGKKATTYTNRIWLDYDDAVAISEGEEVTLMDWGNAIVKGIKKDNGTITQMSGVLHLEGSVKATKLKLTWLPDTNELINLSLVEFDYLINKKKLEVNEDFINHLNPVTSRAVAYLGDSNMRNLKRGEILQLERKGYYICDAPYLRPSKPVVLLSIPDGRAQTSLN